MKKYTYNEVNGIVNNLGYELVSKEYINNKTKIALIDKEGYYYEILAGNLFSGQIPDKFHKSNPYTIQNVYLWCKLNTKPFELLSEIYNGNNKKLHWKCFKKDCGEVFESTLNDIFQNGGCGFCHGKQIGLSNCLATKNPKLASEWHPIKNSELTPYDVTPNSRSFVWWKCKDNLKHEWCDKVANRNSKNSGCPYCSGHRICEDNCLATKNPELAKEWHPTLNGNLTPHDVTCGSNKKVWWQCLKNPKHIWEATIGKRNKGNNCPNCNENKGQTRILYLLNNYLINNIPEKSFSDCKNICLLSFDFYLVDYNFCIEFQGLQHYEPVDFAGRGQEWAEQQFELNQKRDQIKRDYCNKNNIKLIEIPYWDFDNIEEILIKELNLFPQDIKLAI